MADPKPIKLTLFVDKKAEKVLFAESGKDFLDFLFYLPSLPVGTVIGLLKEKGMMGCLGNLHQSIENLNESYLQPNQIKNSILNPKTPISATDIPLWLSDPELQTRKSFACPKCDQYVADVPNLLCPHCKQRMTFALSYVSPSPANTGLPIEGGYVKGLVTYMVMDDLQVMPMSAVHVITLLNKQNVSEVGLIEEKVVELGLDEGLKLLKLSFESKTVLTGVFIGKKDTQDLEIDH